MSTGVHREPPSKHTLKLLIAPVIVLWCMAQAGNIFWATLVEDDPLLLIILNSINRYLILVQDQLDATSYYGVGMLRLLVSDPLFFLLGYWYGERALQWMDRRSPTYGPQMRRAQQFFSAEKPLMKAVAFLIVAAAPNNIICLLAGAVGMRVSLFFAANIIGTAVRLYLIRVFGTQFNGPIDDFRDLVGDYQWWFVGASVLLVAFSMRSELRGGGELDTLTHLDELADDTSAEDDPV